MQSPQDTIAAVATPLGEGGLGVIRVSGSLAIEIVANIFRSNLVDLSQAASHTCYVGGIGEPSSGLRPPPPATGRRPDVPPLPAEGEGGGEGLIDQVVVTLFRAPHSYTGEDVVEISAHGNPLTLQKILSLIVNSGSLPAGRQARLAGPGEFTARAFMNGKMDLTQAEAVAELIRAKADKTQAAALAQMQGHLARKIQNLRGRLLPLLAHLEVGLDHADEDHDFLSRAKLTTGCWQVQNEIDALLQSAAVSKTLREGLRVALIGRPNVGKSSLLNALLKEERAIVTPTPGTTRDTLEESVNLNGIPVVLTDTAGLRPDSQDPIERLGMERTRRSLQDADVVLGLFDGSEAFSAEDEHIVLQAIARPHLWIINKCDLPQGLAQDALESLSGKAPIIRLSAKTGEGLETLIRHITGLDMLEKSMSSEAQWLLNARHQAALLRAKDALMHATQAAEEKNFEECVALELQTALGALGEIIGETTTEDLLDEIFSTFCIGK
jgi:tRNA modification GTPase